MALKRVFISFAMEDENLRNLLVGQSKNSNSPFEFADYSVKQLWDNAWKTNCRTRIKGCNGVIAILTNNTRNAYGQLWEIKCAREEGIPILYIRGNTGSDFLYLPQELINIQPMSWTWDNITSWISRL